MSDGDALRALGALVAGRAGADEVADALGVDAHRLAIYARGIRRARREAAAGLYPHTRVAAGSRWDALLDDYFTARPPRAFALAGDLVSFPAFVAGVLDSPGWWPEIADFELAERLTGHRARDPLDDRPDSGPLRPASTIVLRGYAHDLVTWIDDHERLGAPIRRPITVAFWQDRTGAPFRNALDDDQLAGLLEPATASPEVFEELRAADLLLGG